MSLLTPSSHEKEGVLFTYYFCFKQAVKHAEEEVAKENQAVKDATSSGIQAAATATNRVQPDPKSVEKLVEQIQRSNTGVAALR